LAKVFLVAILLDLIYQIIVLEVYPGEALIVAALLAIAVYCFARRRYSARRNSGRRQAMNETKLGLNDVLALDRHAVGE
jgi:hypothetical protein